MPEPVRLFTLLADQIQGLVDRTFFHPLLPFEQGRRDLTMLLLLGDPAIHIGAGKLHQSPVGANLLRHRAMEGATPRDDQIVTAQGLTRRVLGPGHEFLPLHAGLSRALFMSEL